MFCPKCKSIITKKRINNQIVEFCNCPDKLESSYIAETIPMKKPARKTPSVAKKGKIVTYKERSKKRFTTIQEPEFKPKREPSEYASLPLELRLSPNARLPSFWKSNQIQTRLLKQTDEDYERYYRKIEDYFRKTELKLFISLLPNETLTEFAIDHWGLAFNNPDFTIFYAGTKLNDLGSWDSRLLEKESDVILPYRLFNSYSRSLNFDRLSLGQLVEILRNDWEKYKDQKPNAKIESVSIKELYQNFRKTLFS